MLGPMMLAGIGALCLSNPRRKKRRVKGRRRNPTRDAYATEKSTALLYTLKNLRRMGAFGRSYGEPGTGDGAHRLCSVYNDATAPNILRSDAEHKACKRIAMMCRRIRANHYGSTIQETKDGAWYVDWQRARRTNPRVTKTKSRRRNPYSRRGFQVVYLRPGRTHLVTAGFSEAAMHGRFAGKTVRVKVSDDGRHAYLVKRGGRSVGGGYTPGELGLRHDEDGRLYGLISRDAELWGGVQNNPRRSYRRNPALTSAENLTVLRDALVHRFPFVKVNRMTLGGEERASFSISISLDPRESWANGIYQNSRYRQFMVNADGSLYEISGYGTPRFRKTKVKEITDVVRKLDAWKPQTNPRRRRKSRR